MQPHGPEYFGLGDAGGAAVERTLAAVGQTIQGNVRNELVRTAQLVEVMSDQLVTD